jgi:hypothetical protein
MEFKTKNKVHAFEDYKRKISINKNHQKQKTKNITERLKNDERGRSGERRMEGWCWWGSMISINPLPYSGDSFHFPFPRLSLSSKIPFPQNFLFPNFLK